jgi:hypothetical protein
MLSLVSRLPIGQQGEIRIELSATTRLGPFRLTIDHPAARVVEYYVTLDEALRRRTELEASLDSRLQTSDAACTTKP